MNMQYNTYKHLTNLQTKYSLYANSFTNEKILCVHTVHYSVLLVIYHVKWSNSYNKI